MQTTREQLYKEIWSEAVTKVAAKYGVSDNAIRKKCRRYNIPTPDNKYWGDFRSGKNPAPPPLPEFDGDGKIEFQVSYSLDHPPAKENKPHAQPKELFEAYSLAEKDKYSAIHQSLEVKSQLRNPHLLIVRHMETIKQLKKKKSHDELISIRGINAYGYGPIIDTHSVSEQSLPRLYLFLNALFKAVEDAGGKVVVKERLGSQFVLQGHEINFSSKEKYKLAILPENENKKRRDDERIYTPSGQLTFMLTAKTPMGHRYQREWKEGSKRKLANLIKDIFVVICEFPAYMEHLKAEYAIRLERERQEAEQRRQVQKRHDDEFKATKSLIHEAQLWYMSQQLQEYISSIPVTKDNLEWIRWASKKADWLNPLMDCDDETLLEADKKALLKSDEQYQYKYVPVHKFW